ncbi:DNA replication and repair protein RecO [Allopseudospirillum japonicum]|uniref:DNA replication and repair protein RecO n=1 Tax=Allopseudospirillum japonicum TaxID=64971 RepID=A0A1H6Q1L4_9GAMM|nr:recombination protein O N-terminal domain-containing protein [Allopseudospirillum japonicum]SEI37733.1 DNA replication and repair protein RecO [Allopseudospirillum japonicum]
MHSTPAYLLHQQAYRENKRLVWLLTPQGRLDGVVYKRLYRPALVPLQCEYQGRRSLKQIRTLEAQALGVNLVYKAQVCALYANELLFRLLPSELECHALFLAYVNLLNALQEAQHHVLLCAQALRTFESELLRHLDQEVTLWQLDGQLIQSHLWYTQVEYDGQVAWRVLPESQPTVDAYLGEWIQAVVAGDWSQPKYRHTAKSLFRQRFARLLGHRPLLTYQLLSVFQQAS